MAYYLVADLILVAVVVAVVAEVGLYQLASVVAEVTEEFLPKALPTA